LFVSTGNADFTPMVDYTEVESFHSDEFSLMDIKSANNLNSDQMSLVSFCGGKNFIPKS
jgi:hypothetical protein